MSVVIWLAGRLVGIGDFLRLRVDWSIDAHNRGQIAVSNYPFVRGSLLDSNLNEFIVLNEIDKSIRFDQNYVSQIAMLVATSLNLIFRS